MRLPHRNSLIGLVLAAILAVLAGCGGDGDDEQDAAEGSAAEKAFLTGMVAHHEAAIEMAEIAEEQGESAFVGRLAGDIASAQRREIAQMKRIHRRLFDAVLEPDPDGHHGLGLTAREAGMGHSPELIRMLESADPFDRAFVDEMVPHHEGAVRMSKVLLRRTQDGELRSLAEGIIAAQRREIAEMNAFRARRYGAPVPKARGHRAAPRMHEDRGAHHPR